MTIQFTHQELHALAAMTESGARIDGHGSATERLRGWLDAQFEVDPPKAQVSQENPILSIAALVVREASDLEASGEDVDKGEAWRTLAIAARDEYDDLRRRLAYLHSMAVAYQESERALRDKLQALTGERA